ncbi:hypothetical protein NFI96_014036 [Prochilodus magdalenae]|nr:hypothetical protein NFI96_014036 [Prochilodus magdalenae]
MAALKGSSVWDTPQVYKHHEQQNVCLTRAKYREGRRPKAVKIPTIIFYIAIALKKPIAIALKKPIAIALKKPVAIEAKVYTINLESRFLLVQGVPAIGVMSELVQLFALYGVIEEYRVLDEYPAEQFTEVYLIKFQKLTSARAAKRNTDERSFYGGLLHVCYAPEYETVEDTRKKLQDRRRYVNRASQKTDKDCEQEQPLATPKTTRAESPAPSSPSSEDRIYPQTTYRDSSTSSIQEDSSTYRTHSGFALLPLPPQAEAPQRCLSSKDSLKSLSTHRRTVATEDKMGSLHNFIPSASGHCKDTSHLSQPVSASGCKEREMSKTNKHLSTSVPRFIPRTAHLENRKRRLEDNTDLLGVADKNAPLFGPKLPEPPKVDMEDDSLNKTANLIRQTMTKVASAPLERKTTTAKPRRRI